MRILHVITTIEMGGAEKQLLILCREQIQLGNEVEVLFLKGEPELKFQFEKAGVQVNESLANRPFYLQVLKARRLLISGAHELIHSHLPRAELLVAIAGSTKLVVASRHNAEAFMPKAQKFLSQNLSKFVASRTAGFIFISAAVKEFMIKNSEIPISKMSKIIYYGSDISKPVNAKIVSELSDKFELQGKLVFGTVARLTMQKDYPTLLTAFKNFLGSESNSILLIIGEGELRQNLESLVLRLGIQKEVIFVGKTNLVEEHLALLDAFLLASEYEGFGLVLLEAMQARIPIIASNNSAIPEVLGLDHPGLVQTGNAFQFTERMTAVLEKDFRAQVLRSQDLRLPMFEASQSAKNHQEFYNALLPKGV